MDIEDAPSALTPIDANKPLKEKRLYDVYGKRYQTRCVVTCNATPMADAVHCVFFLNKPTRLLFDEWVATRDYTEASPLNTSEFPSDAPLLHRHDPYTLYALKARFLTLMRDDSQATIFRWCEEYMGDVEREFREYEAMFYDEALRIRKETYMHDVLVNTRNDVDRATDTSVALANNTIALNQCANAATLRRDDWLPHMRAFIVYWRAFIDAFMNPSPEKT